MKKVLVVLAVLVVSASAEAGPFGVFGRRYSNNNSNGGTTYNRPVAQAFLGSAQGVANHLASLGRGVFHMGGNPFAYEGVGMGSTPEQALRNCCNNGGVVADSGVCQGANGMWYACKRYHGR
jgi:hypothetical protein